MKIFIKEKSLMIKGPLAEVTKYLKELSQEKKEEKLVNMLQERLRSSKLGGQ